MKRSVFEAIGIVPQGAPLTIALAAAMLALAGAACSKPKLHASCDAAIDRGMELSVDELAHGISQPLRDHMHRVALAHCAADKWPDGVVGCLAAARDPSEYQSCMTRLPAEAQDRLIREMAALMAGSSTPAGN